MTYKQQIEELEHQIDREMREQKELLISMIEMFVSQFESSDKSKMISDLLKAMSVDQLKAAAYQQGLMS